MFAPHLLPAALPNSAEQNRGAYLLAGGTYSHRVRFMRQDRMFVD